MQVPLQELEDAAREIVRKACLDRTISSLTPRIIRSRIEGQFELEGGTLSASQYKNSLKLAIESAVDAFNTTINPEDDLEKKSKVESQTPTKKRAQPTAKKDAKVPPAKKKRKDDAKAFKSAATIASSDEEEELETKPPVSKVPKQTRESIDDDDTHSPPPQKRRKIDDTQDDSTDSGRGRDVDVKPDSDSAISSLFDEAPKRKKNSKTDAGKGKSKKPSTDKKRKVSDTGLTKDEATIKRLKSFVVACGIRKVWSKVFQKDDTPSQQIKKLQAILADLGMTGRLSLEQAKKIKEQRELAKELEDVQSFEKSTLGQSSSNRKASQSKNRSKIESESDSELGNEIPVRRKKSALLSITAFLDDQSDDE